MVHLEMSFPPSEKGLDIPTQLINLGDLLRCQIPAVGGDPVLHPCRFIGHQPHRAYGLIPGSAAQQDFRVKKDRNQQKLCGKAGLRPIAEALLRLRPSKTSKPKHTQPKYHLNANGSKCRTNAFENLASEDFFQVCVVPSSSEAFSFDAFFQ